MSTCSKVSLLHGGHTHASTCFNAYHTCLFMPPMPQWYYLLKSCTPIQVLDHFMHVTPMWLNASMHVACTHVACPFGLLMFCRMPPCMLHYGTLYLYAHSTLDSNWAKWTETKTARWRRGAHPCLHPIRISENSEVKEGQLGCFTSKEPAVPLTPLLQNDKRDALLGPHAKREATVGPSHTCPSGPSFIGPQALLISFRRLGRQCCRVGVDVTRHWAVPIGPHKPQPTGV